MFFLKYNNKILTRTVILYLMIGVSIISAMGIWMIISYSNKRDDYCERELLKQQNNMYMVDSNVESAYENLQKIAESDEVKYMINLGEDAKSRVYDVTKFMEHLGDWRFPLTPLTDVFVYVAKQQCIYTFQGRYEVDDFYGSYFNCENMHHEEFLAYMTGKEKRNWLPVQNAMILNTQHEVMPVIYTYPNYGTTPDVVVMGLIDAARLTVRPTLESEKDIVYSGILDINNEPLMGNIRGEDISRAVTVKEDSFYIEKVQSEKYMSFVTVSPYNKWKYVEVIPTKLISKELTGYRDAALVIFTCMLIFAFALAFIITKTSIKPLFRIFSHIQRVGYSQNDEKVTYDGIERVVGQIVDSNRQMTEELDRHLKYIKNSFLIGLLNGTAGTEAQIEKRADELKINLTGSRFAVILVWVKNVKLIKKEHGYIADTVFLMSLMDDAFSEQWGIEPVELEKNMVAIIMQARQNEVISYIGFSELLDRLLAEYYDNWKIAIGRTYYTKNDIFYSFIDANATLKFMNIADNSTIMVYNDDIDQNSPFYYPPEIEQRLLGMVLDNDRDGIDKLFKMICNENLKKGIGLLSFKYFKEAIISTIIRIIEENLKNRDAAIENLLRMIDDIEQTESLQEFCDKLKDFTVNLCEIFQISKLQREDKLKDRFEKYIEEHFSDYGLTRKVMAEQFNFSESYFSRKFSELFGKTFSAYLEEKKISMAVQLIKESNLTMNEIAERVGYGNVQVMRRAFVRQLGAPPSKFRNS